jgi:uncharacterized protein YycO
MAQGIKERNDLDLSLLEPGDLLLVANPTDPWYIRYTVFWSHVGMAVDGGVIDAVREPRGEATDLRPKWWSVQRVPFQAYASSHDILALRVTCGKDLRGEAARYAEARIGAPYSPNVAKILFSRRARDHYSCASLAWQAYMVQGIDLAPAPFGLEIAVLPAMLIRSPSVEVIAYGTRYGPAERGRSRLPRLLVRRWFRHLSRADILV